MELSFITGSRHKYEEVAAVIPGLSRIELDLPEIQEIDAAKIIEAKLRSARLVAAGELIVEDTSLHFEALGGLPGPFIKWFMRAIGNHGLADLCRRLGNDRAMARTTIGHLGAAGDFRSFTGAIDGRIVAPRGESDFGWDPIFLPDGSDQTFAEMTRADKNKISMRAEAARQLKEFLDNL